jgi:SAM-dependent methyltransferase
MFDRLVAVSPEASVAAYSLGDPALLAAATAEVVAWLDGLGLLADRPRVLDLGCGIGRIAEALAPRAAGVLGLDIAPAMVAAARARCGDRPGLRFEACAGDDLAGIADSAFDLVLAADVFPYLAQAGLAARMLAEAARVLRPGGHLAVLNFSYRGLAEDRAELPGLAAGAGLSLCLDGGRPLRSWDAAAFLLQRDAPGGGLV